jgi:hypothetical protein
MVKEKNFYFNLIYVTETRTFKMKEKVMEIAMTRHN